MIVHIPLWVMFVLACAGLLYIGFRAGVIVSAWVMKRDLDAATYALVCTQFRLANRKRREG